MSKKRLPEPDSSDDERLGQEAENELTSSSSDEELHKAVRKANDKPKPKTEKPKRNRIPQSKRVEVIQKAIEGKLDPEYSAKKNGKSWIVRRRDFPLDQTPKLDDAIPSTVNHAPPKPTPDEEPPKRRDDDLHLSYVNQQASINSKLSKDLESLSQKYDQLAEKYERHKRKKDDIRKYEAELRALMEDEEQKEKLRTEIKRKYSEPPRSQPQPPQSTAPPKMPVGKYARGRPLSIFEV
jgi:hypothetical protein